MNLINPQKVKQFQELFDSVGTKPNFDNWQLRVKLIQEELDELKEAFETNDMVEVADAYGDIMFLVLGGVCKHGIPYFDKIFDEICDSNLSKSDETLDDAMLSKEKYTKDNIETHIESKNDRFIIRRNQDNKVLKSHKYTPVSLEKYFTMDDLDQELYQILDELEIFVQSGNKFSSPIIAISFLYHIESLRGNKNYFETTILTSLVSLLDEENNIHLTKIKYDLLQNINGRLTIKFEGFTK